MKKLILLIIPLLLIVGMVSASDCTDEGYKCTSAIRGCGLDYEQLDYSCPEYTICCEDVSYCGDGICDTEISYPQPENGNTCPEDCGIQQACTKEYAPVCGADGNTYGNDCLRRQAGVDKGYDGACTTTTTIPDTCIDSETGKNYYKKGTISSPYWEHTDTCGILEHITWGDLEEVYSCKDEEGCVLYEVFCSDNAQSWGSSSYKCPNGCSDGACIKSSEACTTEYDPVCGTDGKTYGNDCLRRQAGVGLQHKGVCEASKVFVDIEVLPSEQTIGANQKALYNVKVTDKHNDGKTHAYGIGTRSLSLDSNHPTMIYVKAGDSTTFDLIVHSPNSVLENKREDFEVLVIEQNNLYNYKLGSAVLNLQSTPPQDQKYVKLEQEFNLKQGQSVKVTDYNYMKVTHNNWMCTGACVPEQDCSVNCAISLIVDMPGDYVIDDSMQQPISNGRDNVQQPTSTSTEIVLQEGESKEVFGAKIIYIDKEKNSARLVVEKARDYVEGVDIEISPKEKTISYGDKAVYNVRITDKHNAIDSTNKPSYTYFINVRNLPLSKEYPNKIELKAGQSKSFEIVVNPYDVVLEETSSSRVESPSVIVGSVVEDTNRYALTKNVRAVEAVAEVPEEQTVLESSISYPIHYRSYKFNVVAFEKNNPKNQDIDYAVLNIKPQKPPITPPPFPGEEVKIELYKGWNLISLPGKLIKFEKLDSDKKLIGFVYLKKEQRYVTIREAKQVLGDGFNEYLARNSFWVYSYENTVLRVRVDFEVNYSDINLYKGWNLVPITEDMVGGYLRDIKGDCSFEKLYLWDAKRQSWSKITEDYQFSQKDINYGFLVKSTEDCRLGGVTISLSPPPMPE